MITGTERLLLEKYRPNDPLLREPLQAPVSLSVDDPLHSVPEHDKAADIALQAISEASISQITKALLTLIKKIEKKDSNGKN
jgi:hypothetical protein